MYITYAASLDPPQAGTLYRWDYSNDGLFDTGPNPDPTAHTGVSAEQTRDRPGAGENGRQTVQATVRFRTMRCD